MTFACATDPSTPSLHLSRSFVYISDFVPSRMRAYGKCSASPHDLFAQKLNKLLLIDQQQKFYKCYVFYYQLRGVPYYIGLRVDYFK